MASNYRSQSSFGSIRILPSDWEKKKRFAKILPFVQLGLAVALTFFSIIIFALIQPSLMYKDEDVKFATEKTLPLAKSSIKLNKYIYPKFAENIRTIAEYNGVSGFMIIMVGVTGIIVWSSSSPRKFAVKAHFVLLCVVLLVLSIYINSTFFHLITLSKIPAAIKSKYDKKPKVTVKRYNDDDYDDDEPKSEVKGNPLDSTEYGILVTVVVLQWLILFIWFIQILLHFAFAALICLNFEDIIGSQTQENVPEGKIPSLHRRKKVKGNKSPQSSQYQEEIPESNVKSPPSPPQKEILESRVPSQHQRKVSHKAESSSPETSS